MPCHCVNALLLHVMLCRFRFVVAENLVVSMLWNIEASSCAALSIIYIYIYVYPVCIYIPCIYIYIYPVCIYIYTFIYMRIFIYMINVTDTF